MPARPIVTQVDEDILQKLVSLNFNPEEVKKNVLSYNFVSQERQERERKLAERATPPSSPAASDSATGHKGDDYRTRRFSLLSYATPPATAPGSPPPAQQQHQGDSTTEITPLPPSHAHPALLPPAEKDKTRRHSLNLTSTGVAAKEGTVGSGSVDGSRVPTTKGNNPKEGFLAKIFGRTGAGAGATASSGSAVPLAAPAPAPASGEPKPPPMKGAFNAHTVTSKPIAEIQDQIQKALEKMRIEYEIGKKGFGYKCRADAVRFSIKICAIEKFDMKGLKFKRTQGDLWDFQKLHQQIVDNLNI
eukprot:TRINITY_DN566_c0_g1_i7.p1 TRINITY_DN566_c0_g1~~TRINITY_DN566_c0_g1_i7.p1  ORF type:complete len:303 (-),score=121.60 TRINITY_DN566_c0_g1_i7:322-1230(-)